MSPENWQFQKENSIFQQYVNFGGVSLKMCSQSEPKWVSGSVYCSWMFSCQWHSEFRILYLAPLTSFDTSHLSPRVSKPPSYSKATKMKGSVTFLKLSTWIHIRMLRDFWDGKVVKSQVDSRSTPDLIWSWFQQICENHVCIFITSSSWNLWKDDVDTVYTYLYITSPSSTSSSSCPISLPHTFASWSVWKACPLLSRLHR